MTETTARIRWEEDGAGGFEGYAGTLQPHMFTLWQSPCDGGDYVIGDWVLVSTFPMPADANIGYTHAISGKTADGLKAKAEQQLSGFVSALGAGFAEQYAGWSENEGGTAVQLQPRCDPTPSAPGGAGEPNNDRTET